MHYKGNSRAVDLLGKRFGRLIVIGREPNRPKVSDAIWRCTCDCGGENVVRASHLKSGNVSSCGCLCRDRVSAEKRRHGMDRTKTYYAWSGIKQRCRNPRNQMYRYYGGRGIDVCERWHSSFDAFLEDMGVAPEGSSIDRIDNDRGYEPGTCRWTTSKEQGRNKRNNRLIRVDDVSRTLSEWAEATGVPKTTICSRLRRGMTPRDALGKAPASSGEHPVPDPGP